MKTLPSIFLALCLTLLTSNLAAQQIYETEKIDDPYLPMLARDKKTSEAYFFENSSILTIQVNTDEEGNNIINDAANEPSLAVDLNNPERMVIGWRQFDNIKSNFRQAGIAHSMDAGESWNFMEPLEKGIFRSDPVLSSTMAGEFYYNSLSADLFCDVFASNSLIDWSDKTYAYGGDKQWMVVDNTNNPSNGNIYAFWKPAFSDCDGNFTRSTDMGASYEECSLAGSMTRGTLAIGPDGELYACGGGAGTHIILKSSSAKDPAAVVSWEIEKEVNLKGEQALYDGPNPSGMLGQVWIAADHSDLETRGNVYLLSTTKRNDNGDPADIMFSRSEDGGENWSEAIKINDDSSTSNWQWFGTLSVAPNGRINAAWLDNRDFPQTFLSSLYYSQSLDGGLTWSANQKLSEPFDPHLGWPQQQKMGDYFHMISTNEEAHLAWAATFNGEQDIYYSRIDAIPEVSSTAELETERQAIAIYPNPANEFINISLSVPMRQEVQLTFYDALGKQYSLPQKHALQAGNNVLVLAELAALNLPKGLLFLELRSEQGWTSGARVVWGR